MTFRLLRYRPPHALVCTQMLTLGDRASALQCRPGEYAGARPRTISAKCSHLYSRRCWKSLASSEDEGWSQVLKPKEVIQATEKLDSKIDPAEKKQAQVEKEKLVAVNAAENEGLPVVGLGDEKQSDKAA